MKKVFEILPPSVEAANCILICEVSNEGFSFTIKDENQNLFVALSVYHFDKSTPPVGFPIALQIVFHENKLLSEPYKKIIIIYSFSESVLVPFSLYDGIQNEDVLNLVHGDLPNNDTIFTDIITGQNMYNFFRISTLLLDVINAQFPTANCLHQYSFLLRQPTEKNKLSIIFYSQKMVVSLVKNGKHQLINSFSYHSPEEVSYTLLNICEQFDVPEIDIEICGLVEKKSSLFKDIYKYFQNVEMSVLPEGKNVSEEILQYPAHYFSHILALDSCV
jgi:hypothetical protein